MLKPSDNIIKTKNTSQYAVVIAVAKRAREINEKDNVKLTEANAVSLAVKEIADGKVAVSIPSEEKTEKFQFDADSNEI